MSEVQKLRREQQALDIGAQRRHASERTTQLRLGHAIDALAMDEARLLSRANEMANALRAQSEALDRAVRRLLAAVRNNDAAERGQGRALDALHMSSLTRDWAHAQEAYFAAQTALAENENARADLRFQISHLKGRLAGLDAGGADADASAREQQLDAQISGKLFAIRLETERMTQDIAERR